MQAIELPRQIQITPECHNERAKCHGFIFTNLKDGKPIRLNYCSKSTVGIVISVETDLDTHLAVALSRESGNRVGFNVFNLTYQFRLVKRSFTQLQCNSINSRHILRFYGKKQKLIYYHESHANIEIRNSVSLKRLSTFSLAEICKEVGLSASFSDLKTSMNLDYIPHLSSMILLLGSKIVMVSEKKTKPKPSVIFNITGHEMYHNIIYQEKRKVLLVEGITSILLMGLDNMGISQLRILKSNLLGRASKLLCWNPIEEVFVVSQRISPKKENHYVLSYATPNLTHIGSLMNIPCYGNHYDEDSQSLFFIEGEGNYKNVSFLEFKGISARLGCPDKPAILEGECLVYIPENLDCDDFYIRYYKDTLIVKRKPHPEDKFTR